MAVSGMGSPCWLARMAAGDGHRTVEVASDSDTPVNVLWDILWNAKDAAARDAAKDTLAGMGLVEAPKAAPKGPSFTRVPIPTRVPISGPATAPDRLPEPFGGLGYQLSSYVADAAGGEGFTLLMDFAAVAWLATIPHGASLTAERPGFVVIRGRLQYWANARPEEVAAAVSAADAVEARRQHDRVDLQASWGGRHVLREFGWVYVPLRAAAADVPAPENAAQGIARLYPPPEFIYPETGATREQAAGVIINLGDRHRQASPAEFLAGMAAGLHASLFEHGMTGGPAAAWTEEHMPPDDIAMAERLARGAGRDGGPISDVAVDTFEQLCEDTLGRADLLDYLRIMFQRLPDAARQGVGGGAAPAPTRREPAGHLGYHVEDLGFAMALAKQQPDGHIRTLLLSEEAVVAMARQMQARGSRGSIGGWGLGSRMAEMSVLQLWALPLNERENSMRTVNTISLSRPNEDIVVTATSEHSWIQENISFELVNAAAQRIQSRRGTTEAASWLSRALVKDAASDAHRTMDVASDSDTPVNVLWDILWNAKDEAVREAARATLVDMGLVKEKPAAPVRAPARFRAPAGGRQTPRSSYPHWIPEDFGFVASYFRGVQMLLLREEAVFAITALPDGAGSEIDPNGFAIFAGSLGAAGDHTREQVIDELISVDRAVAGRTGEQIRMTVTADGGGQLVFDVTRAGFLELNMSLMRGERPETDQTGGQAPPDGWTAEALGYAMGAVTGDRRITLLVSGAAAELVARMPLATWGECDPQQFRLINGQLDTLGGFDYRSVLDRTFRPRAIDVWPDMAGDRRSAVFRIMDEHGNQTVTAAVFLPAAQQAPRRAQAGGWFAPDLGYDDYVVTRHGDGPVMTLLMTAAGLRRLATTVDGPFRQEVEGGEFGVLEGHLGDNRYTEMTDIELRRHIVPSDLINGTKEGNAVHLRASWGGSGQMRDFGVVDVTPESAAPAQAGGSGAELEDADLGYDESFYPSEMSHNARWTLLMTAEAHERLEHLDANRGDTALPGDGVAVFRQRLEDYQRSSPPGSQQARIDRERILGNLHRAVRLQAIRDGDFVSLTVSTNEEAGSIAFRGLQIPWSADEGAEGEVSPAGGWTAQELGFAHSFWPSSLARGSQWTLLMTEEARGRIEALAAGGMVAVSGEGVAIIENSLSSRPRRLWTLEQTRHSIHPAVSLMAARTGDLVDIRARDVWGEVRFPELRIPPAPARNENRPAPAGGWTPQAFGYAEALMTADWTLLVKEAGMRLIMALPAGGNMEASINDFALYDGHLDNSGDTSREEMVRQLDGSVTRITVSRTPEDIITVTAAGEDGDEVVFEVERRDLADLMGNRPAAAPAREPAGDLRCQQCGHQMTIGADGLSHHLDPGGGYDHAQDGDHVAVAEEEGQDAPSHPPTFQNLGFALSNIRPFGDDGHLELLMTEAAVQRAAEVPDRGRVSTTGDGIAILEGTLEGLRQQGVTLEDAHDHLRWQESCIITRRGDFVDMEVSEENWDVTFTRVPIGFRPNPARGRRASSVGVVKDAVILPSHYVERRDLADMMGAESGRETSAAAGSACWFKSALKNLGIGEKVAAADGHRTMEVASDSDTPVNVLWDILWNAKDMAVRDAAEANLREMGLVTDWYSMVNAGGNDQSLLKRILQSGRRDDVFWEAMANPAAREEDKPEGLSLADRPTPLDDLLGTPYSPSLDGRLTSTPVPYVIAFLQKVYVEHVNSEAWAISWHGVGPEQPYVYPSSNAIQPEVLAWMVNEDALGNYHGYAVENPRCPVPILLNVIRSRESHQFSAIMNPAIDEMTIISLVIDPTIDWGTRKSALKNPNLTPDGLREIWQRLPAREDEGEGWHNDEVRNGLVSLEACPQDLLNSILRGFSFASDKTVEKAAKNRNASRESLVSFISRMDQEWNGGALQEALGNPALTAEDRVRWVESHMDRIGRSHEDESGGYFPVKVEADEERILLPDQIYEAMIETKQPSDPVLGEFMEKAGLPESIARRVLETTPPRIDNVALHAVDAIPSFRVRARRERQRQENILTLIMESGRTDPVAVKAAEENGDWVAVKRLINSGRDDVVALAAARNNHHLKPDIFKQAVKSRDISAAVKNALFTNEKCPREYFDEFVSLQAADALPKPKKRRVPRPTAANVTWLKRAAADGHRTVEVASDLDTPVNVLWDILWNAKDEAAREAARVTLADMGLVEKQALPGVTTPWTPRELGFSGQFPLIGGGGRTLLIPDGTMSIAATFVANRDAQSWEMPRGTFTVVDRRLEDTIGMTRGDIQRESWIPTELFLAKFAPTNLRPREIRFITHRDGRELQFGPVTLAQWAGTAAAPAAARPAAGQGWGRGWIIQDLGFVASGNSSVGEQSMTLLVDQNTLTWLASLGETEGWQENDPNGFGLLAGPLTHWLARSRDDAEAALARPTGVAAVRRGRAFNIRVDLTEDGQYVDLGWIGAEDFGLPSSPPAAAAPPADRGMTAALGYVAEYEPVLRPRPALLVAQEGATWLVAIDDGEYEEMTGPGFSILEGNFSDFAGVPEAQAAIRPAGEIWAERDGTTFHIVENRDSDASIDFGWCELPAVAFIGPPPGQPTAPATAEVPAEAPADPSEVQEMESLLGADWKVVRLDETHYYDAAFLSRIRVGRVWSLHLYDKNRHFHLASTQSSYELHYLGFSYELTGVADDDPRWDEINEGADEALREANVDTGSVEYYGVGTIDRLPSENQVDWGYTPESGDTYEGVVEHLMEAWQQNPAF